MPSPHLYLVDGSSYIFRAFHRLPPLTNKHGLNVGAVYGYTTMLWKLVDGLNRDDGPTHLAVMLDASESTFRNEMYDQYKANRPPPPPELVPQFPLIRDATRAFSVPCLEQDGLEADDIIACYAKAALAEGLAGHHRLLGQGSDAADRAGARHARHDERPAGSAATR